MKDIFMTIKILIGIWFFCGSIEASQSPQLHIHEKMSELGRHSERWLQVRTLRELQVFLTSQRLPLRDWVNVIDDDTETLIHKLTENGPL
jgi:hypothetical protein